MVSGSGLGSQHTRLDDKTRFFPVRCDNTGALRPVKQRPREKRTCGHGTNRKTGSSWKIIITMPNGPTCMVAAGENREKIPHTANAGK